MLGANAMKQSLHFSGISKLAISAVILTAVLPASAFAQQPGQKTYASAEDAGKALVEAAKSDDMKAMLAVLGKDGKQIVSSGDPKEDAQNRESFVKRYETMHRLVKEPDGTTTLYVGAENWPTPIALVQKGDLWHFDTEAAKREILYRRIGHNEMSAIRVCQELVMAQKEFFAKEGNEYAQKFLSDEGKQNGLHWPSTDKKDRSPIGPLVAEAGTDSATAADAKAESAPFRGYYFRILTSQGKDVTGGAMSYIADGKMTKGFAFVAYPAVYRDSGVMTFVIDQDGIVYEKDLGKQTVSLAKAIKAYDADSTWRKSDIAEQLAEEHTTK
jgi:hypothetical protein